MKPNASGDWVEVDCIWFDNVQALQNKFYSERNFESSPILILYGVICSFGALANLVVLFAFCRSEKLRNLRNSFIVNLACSDLLLCVVTAPITLYTSVNFFWPFGDIPCKLMASVQAMNTFVSSLTLALIALDRVLLTLCPVKWRLAATAPLLCYAAVWLISILVALPYSLAVRSQVVKTFEPWSDRHTPEMLKVCGRERPEVCIEIQETWERAFMSKTSFTVLIFALQYVLPLAALAFAYVQIGHTIRRRSKVARPIDQARREHMQGRNRRALLLLLLLVLTYAICWAPMNIYNLLSGFDMIEYSQYRYLFCHLVGISSACVNPITYALVNESFRNALKNAVLSFRPCYVTTRAQDPYTYRTKLQEQPLRDEATDTAL